MPTRQEVFRELAALADTLAPLVPHAARTFLACVPDELLPTALWTEQDGTLVCAWDRGLHGIVCVQVCGDGRCFVSSGTRAGMAFQSVSLQL